MSIVEDAPKLPPVLESGRPDRRTTAVYSVLSAWWASAAVDRSSSFPRVGVHSFCEADGGEADGGASLK
jgi:hypothetical protein